MDDPPSGAADRAIAKLITMRQAFERHARLDERSGRAALSQGRRQRGEAVLHWPRADGEPQRAFR